MSTIKIENVTEEKKPNKEGRLADKIILHSTTKTGSIVEIDELAINGAGGIRKRGLWVTLDADGRILKGSAIAELLEFNNVKTPLDLIGKDINVWWNPKGYIAAATFDLAEAEALKA